MANAGQILDLQAEIDRLKEAKRKFSLLCDEKGAENVKLRQENERLKAEKESYELYISSTRQRDAFLAALPLRDEQRGNEK